MMKPNVILLVVPGILDGGGIHPKQKLHTHEFTIEPVFFRHFFLETVAESQKNDCLGYA